MIKKILSYAFPLKQKSFESRINPGLELRWEDGVLVLNSKKANYSFGNLHKVFDKTFYQLQIKSKEPLNVLLLGMGAGSVIKLLQNKYLPNCKITAVELDPIVIDIAANYFEIKENESLEIVGGDAALFVQEGKNKYDLIIADLFIDTIVPNLFTQELFYLKVAKSLNPNGMFIQNLMPKNKIQSEQAISSANQVFSNIKMLSPLPENKVMVCQKQV